MEKGTGMNLAGLLANIPTSEELSVDAHVSVFQRKNEQLMVGPLSFINRSRWPNSFHTINQEVMSLRSLRTRTEGEKITEVWAGVFWQLQRRMFVSTYRTPFKGEDLLECVGDAPTLYGRKIARRLWSREELSNSIMSPGKNLEFREYPRSPMIPTRTLSSMVNSFMARIDFRK